jgi:ABC-type Fe3+-hydroxamate transport system substrate-binding protein
VNAPGADSTGTPARVVSLVPSVTETLLSWGVTPVAVTRFCEVPGLPTVGGTKTPDVAAIVALSPDLVVMDTEENRIVDAETLQAAGVEVLATCVRSVPDVADALSQLAAALGHSPAGTPIFSAPRASMAPRLTAWVPIWRRPWMSIGGRTYGSSLLAAAGADNVYASSEDPYPTLELADVRRLHPDVVLAPSEPYKFGERHRSELEKVGPVVFVDGRDLFWWGSRTPTALERLRDLVAHLAAR